MKLLLTSFGVSHLPRKKSDSPDIFYRMPPVSMSQLSRGFLPEYAVLLLANEIILDKTTYDLLMTARHESYSDVAVMIRALYDEGFIRFEDFDAVVQDKHTMLEEMLQHDLKELDLWVEPLKQASATWLEFVRFLKPLREEIYQDRLEKKDLSKHEIEKHELYQTLIAESMHNMGSHAISGAQKSHFLLDEALDSARKRRKAEYRDALREHLTEYLSYVNANLLLAHTFDAGFHDWYDFQPFYREKFLRVARDAAPGEKEVGNVKKLFEVSFPEFTFWQPENVIRALKDKRIAELRSLVDQASKGEVQFDLGFANRVLQEVFRIEASIGSFRNIVSYTTMPLGLIPLVGTPIQKAVEEAITRPVESHKRKPYRWFYLISELSKKTEKHRANKADAGDSQ